MINNLNPTDLNNCGWNMKPLSFKAWLKLMGKETIYPKAHPLLKGRLHRRYEKYLDGWELNAKNNRHGNDG